MLRGVLALNALAIAVAAGVFAILQSDPPSPVSEPGGGPPALTRAPVAEIPTGAARCEVIGDGPAVRIDYSIVGNESVRYAQILPWCKSTGATFMSVSAQRGAGPGSITCRITGGGRVIAENTNQGPYAVCRVADIVD